MADGHVGDFFRVGVDKADDVFLRVSQLVQEVVVNFYKHNTHLAHHFVSQQHFAIFSQYFYSILRHNFAAFLQDCSAAFFGSALPASSGWPESNYFTYKYSTNKEFMPNIWVISTIFQENFPVRNESSKKYWTNA